MIRISGFEKESIVDGPGIRYVVFTQGCSHHCKGCHNPETWDPAAGRDMTAEEIYEDIVSRDHLDGVTFSGGEPFEQTEELLKLARMLNEKGISMMSYTGYTLEELRARRDPATDELLGLLDILVDGRYVEALRNLTLVYRGSENQRVLDMKKTTDGKIVFYRSEYDDL